MIQIHVIGKNKIDKITTKGHSGYAPIGSDIVCSSVSCILITSINAILKIDETSIFYRQDEGFLEVTIKKHTKIIDLLIENMLELLKELENDYKKYIKIYKEVS